MKQYAGMKNNWRKELNGVGWKKMRGYKPESDFDRYTKFDYDEAVMLYLDIDCFGRFYLMVQPSPTARLVVIGTERSVELDSDETFKGKTYRALLETIYQEVV